MNRKAWRVIHAVATLPWVLVLLFAALVYGMFEASGREGLGPWKSRPRPE